MLYSAWMISAFRQSISIINLFKSIVMFRLSFLIFTNIISFQGPIWFINMDKSVDRYVKYAALNCGEFSVTSRWIRGAISNYRVVFNAYRRLMNLSGTVLSSKKKSFNNFFNSWFLSRYSWPRAIFISSLHTSYFPAKEALLLKIPAISIVDTNSWTQASSIPIPGNDESLGCLIFYNDIISNFILSRKFNLVSIWFFNIRSISRIVNFVDWVSKSYTIQKNLDISNIITFKPNMLNSYLKSFGLFLSNSYWTSILKDKLDIFNFKNSLVNLSILFPTFLDIKKKIIMSLNIHFFKKIWLIKKFFKKNFFTDLNFKLKFLKKGFFHKKFITENYLKSALINTKFNSDFFLAISNLYFLQRYLKKISLPNYTSSKLRYWILISNFLLNKFVSKSKLWVENSKNLPKITSLTINLNYSNSLDLALSNKLILLAKSKTNINKLKFFISRLSFDSHIPKYLWFWNSNFFIPALKNLDNSSSGYFFKKFFITSYNNGKSKYFSDLLDKHVNKNNFSGSFNYKWYWF